MPHYDSDQISPLAWAVNAVMQNGEQPSISCVLKNAKCQWQEWDKMRRASHQARIIQCVQFAGALDVDPERFLLIVFRMEEFRHKRWSIAKLRDRAIRLASKLLHSAMPR